MKKKFIAITFLLLITFGMIGCGKNQVLKKLLIFWTDFWNWYYALKKRRNILQKKLDFNDLIVYNRIKQSKLNMGLMLVRF